jgi:hypothetical protein
MREVYALARRCCGGVILGFEQYAMASGLRKRGTLSESKVDAEPIRLPSPWNQIEGGILFGLRLPILIFREVGVEGGIFDSGSSGVFIHPMPDRNTSRRAMRDMKSVIEHWAASVRNTYYDY